jgi:membrane protease YdiL (CAAX protease family)
VPPKESPLEDTKTITHAPEAHLGMAGLIAAFLGVALTDMVASLFLAVGPDWFSQTATPEDVVRRIVLPGAFAGTLALAIVLRLGWRRGCGFVVPPLRPGLLVGLVPACLLVVAGVGIAFRGFPSAQAGFVPTLLFGQFMIGFNEETASRGILLHGLERLRSRRFALILSSVLFGVTHLAGLAFGLPLGESLNRVLGASILGLMLGVVRLRTGSIWFPIAIHGLWNFAFLGALTIPESELGPLADLPVLAVFSVPVIVGLLRLVERVQRGRRPELVGTRGARPDLLRPDISYQGPSPVAGRRGPTVPRA